MRRKQKVTNLEQLLDGIAEAARARDRLSLSKVLEVVGRRSFGPLLLAAGLVALAPVVGDIPGVPTMVGTLVFLIAVQLLFGRNYFWLPRWLLKRSVAGERLRKALKWMRRPARFVDRLLRPRLTILTEGGFIHGIALLCVVVAISMPAMEVVPFVANVAGAAFTAFGLSLIARDGLLALIALAFTAAVLGLLARTLL